jgi:hypothetical protein
MRNIPREKTINGRKFNLYKYGSSKIIKDAKEDIKQFNRTQMINAGKSWRNYYKYRVYHFGNISALYIY